MRRKTMKGGNLQEAQRRIQQWIENGDVDAPLDVSYLNLKTLPNIPDNVKILICMGNNLNTLPTLPNSLKRLSCYANKLTTLPTLPNSLELLYCHINFLTTLPTLPNSLKVLDCAYNKLTRLPTLPETLEYLVCNNNNNLPAQYYKNINETMNKYVKRIKNIQKVQKNLKSHITNKKRNTFANTMNALPRNVMREVASYMNSNNLKNININSLKPSNITRKKKKNSK